MAKKGLEDTVGGNVGDRVTQTGTSLEDLASQITQGQGTTLPKPSPTPPKITGPKPLLSPTKPAEVQGGIAGRSKKGMEDKVKQPPRISKDVIAGSRLYFNPDNNLIGTDETKFPLYIDKENQFSIVPDSGEAAFANIDQLFPKAEVTPKDYVPTSLRPEPTPERTQPYIGPGEGIYSSDDWMTQTGWISRHTRQFNDFVYNTLTGFGLGGSIQREHQAFSIINPMTGQPEHISVDASRAFTNDPQKAKKLEAFSRWWWASFTNPISNQLNRMAHSNPIIKVPIQAWSAGYDAARLLGTSVWKYTVGDWLDTKVDRKQQLLDKTMEKYAEYQNMEEYQTATELEKLAISLYAPIDVMFNDYMLDEERMGDGWNTGTRLAWKFVRSTQNLNQTFDEIRQRVVEMKDAGVEQDTRDWKERLFGSFEDPFGMQGTLSQTEAVLQYERDTNTELAQIQQDSFEQALLSTDPGEALGLMEDAYAAMYQRTDVSSDLTAGTWLMAPDANEREAAFLNALAQATIQKGEWLTKYEKYAIMQRYVDPGTEFAYEMVADLTNLIPAAMMDEMMKGTKGIAKSVLGAQDEFLTKIAPEGYKLVKDFFHYNGLKAAGTKMKSRATRLVYNLSRQIDTTDELAETLLKLGTTLRERQAQLSRQLGLQEGEAIPFANLTRAQRVELGISDRVASWADTLDRAFVSFGTKGEDWGAFVDDAYKVVYDHILKLELSNGFALVEATEKATAFASKAKNIAPVLADNMEKMYLASHRIWKGGPLENTFSAWFAKKAGKNIDNFMLLRLREGLNTFSRISTWMNQAWMKAVLTARPGFTVINFTDSVFRALINGAAPFQSFDNVIGKIDNEIIESFMSNDIFLGTSVGRLMVEEGWRPNHVGELFMRGFKLSDAEGMGKFGLGKNISRAMDGMIAVNAGTEFTWRARVFATEYEKTLTALKQIAKGALQEEYETIFKSMGLGDEVSDEVSHLVEVIWGQTDNPEQMKALINEMITGVPSGAPSPVMVPKQIMQDLYSQLPREKANEVMRRVTYAIRDVIDNGTDDVPVAINRAIQSIIDEMDTEINAILDNYKQLSFGDEFLNGMATPPTGERQLLNELESFGIKEQRAELLEKAVKPDMPEGFKPMYDELATVDYGQWPEQIKYWFRREWQSQIRGPMEGAKEGLSSLVRRELERMGIEIGYTSEAGAIRFKPTGADHFLRVSKDEIYTFIDTVIGTKDGTVPSQFQDIINAGRDLVLVHMSNSDPSYLTKQFTNPDTVQAYLKYLGKTLTPDEAMQLSEKVATWSSYTEHVVNATKKGTSVFMEWGDSAVGSDLALSTLTKYTDMDEPEILNAFNNLQDQYGKYFGPHYVEGVLKDVPKTETGVFQNGKLHQQILFYIEGGTQPSEIPEGLRDLYRFWDNALANEVFVQLNDDVAEIYTKQLVQEAVKETADAGKTVIHNTDFNYEVLRSIAAGDFTKTLNELPKTKLVNMPEPIADQMRKEIEGIRNFDEQQLSDWIDVFNRRYVEMGGNPSHVIDADRMEHIFDDILNGTEAIADSTGKEFMFYETTRTMLLEQAGANFEQLDSLVDEMVRMKLAGTMDDFTIEGNLADFYEFNTTKGNAKYNLWEQEHMANKFVDPKKIVKRNYARESGEAYAVTHSAFAKMIHSLGASSPSQVREMVAQGGIDSLTDLIYLQKVNENLSYMIAGPLHAWTLDVGPGPLSKTGAARNYAWNDFFELRGRMYETSNEEMLRLMAATPEERIAMFEGQEFISVHDFLSRSGVDLRYDINGNLIEIDFHKGRRVRYPPHIRQFEEMFGLKGEEAFRAPFVLGEAGSSLQEQVTRMVSFDQIRFEDGLLPRLNETFGVPDFEYNQGMRPGSKRYNVPMPDGTTQHMTSSEVANFYLDNDNFHENKYNYFGRRSLYELEGMADTAMGEAHAAYLEEHPIEAYLRLWLVGGPDASDYKVVELAHYMENTEQGQKIQDFTTWFLYHEHGDKVSLWNGKVTVHRGVKEGRAVRPWDSMTRSQAVASHFHDVTTKWEIPIENIAISNTSFPPIDEIFMEDEWILNARGIENATLLEVGGQEPSAEDLLRFGVTPKENAGVSAVAAQIQAKWAEATHSGIEEMGGSSLKRLYPDHADNPMKLIEHLDNLIRTNKELGRQNLVDIYVYRRAQAESLYHQILKSEGLADGVIILPPSPRHLPPGRSNILVNGETMLRQVENSKKIVRNWSDELIGMVDENPELYMRIKPSEKELFTRYGQFAADIRQQMEELAVYGSDVRADLDNFVSRGIPEEYLNQAAQSIENNLHPAFQGLDIQGALHKTNTSMLDYNHYSGFDELMMVPFPFWKFPSRSLPFWMETLITKPQITSFYMKHVRTSRRYAYQAGATTTYGDSLPSLTGYIPIPGTEIWINPTAPFSFTYAMPEDNYNYDEFSDTQMPIAREVAAYLYRNGTRFGLSPSPWLTFIAYETGLMSDADFPRWSIIPQSSFIPPFAHRWIEQAIRRTAFPKAANLYTKLFNPDVEWSDYLVERKLLSGALEKLQNSNMTEAEKVAYLNTVILAVNFSTSVRANNASDNAVDQVAQLLVDLEYDGNMVDVKELSAVQQAKVDKAREMWEQAQNELDTAEYYRDLFGYFSGIYGKEFTNADAELLQVRDDINALKWQLVTTLNWDVDPEKLRFLYGGEYGDDVEALYDTYINERYNTDEGKIADLYQAMGWIDIPTIPPEGGVYSIDELKQLRKKVMAERISVDLVTEARYDATGMLHQWLEDSLATIPIGDSATRSLIWQEYFEKRSAIEINPLYAEANREWHVGYKPQELLAEHFRDLMWQMVKETQPQYDRENQTYEEWRASVDQWKGEIPEMTEAIMTAMEKNMFSYLSEQKPGQDLMEIRRNLEEELAGGAESYDAWDAAGDTELDAANKAWTALYMQPYFDAIEGLHGTEFDIAVREFYQEHSEPPTTEEMTDWIMQNYGDQFTPDRIKAAIEGTSVYTVDDKFYDPNNGFSTQEDDVWSALSWVKPGQYYGDFMDAYLKNGGSESDLDIWYTVGGNALAYKDPTAFMKFHDTLLKTINEMEIAEPTIDEMKIWVEAETLNTRFKEQVVEALGDSFYGDMAYYFSLSSKEKKEYKKENTTISDAIDAYFDMKDEFAEIHQVWAQFYHRQAYNGEDGGITQTGSNYYGSSSGASGGSSGHYSGGSSSSGYSSRDDATPDDRPFVGVGSRSVLSPKYLLGQIGNARPAGRPHWPIHFVEEAGEVLVSQVKKMEDGTIEHLSPAAEKVAKKLIDAYPKKYESFLNPYLQAPGGVNKIGNSKPMPRLE